MKISIIIPVYNVEKYIRKCLLSIYEQDLSECFYEVIVVNDGTTDDSMRIVKDFAIRHSNLRILEKENGGVSSARNEGLKAAKGDYVTFIDADDWIETGCLSNVFVYLSSHSSLEVLICHSNNEDGKECYPWNDICKLGTEYTGVEIYELGYRRGSVCGSFFQRFFLVNNDLFFPIGVRNGEDSIFFNIVLSCVNKISCIDIPFYVVYERMGSASRTFEFEHLKLMAHTLESTYNLVIKHSVRKTPAQCDILVEMLYMQISALTYIAIKIGGFSLKQILQCVDIKHYLPIRFQTVNRKGWKLTLLNFSYPLFYYLIKLKLYFLCFNH